MKQKSSLDFVKMIMVVTTFICLGALIGAIGYLSTKLKIEPVAPPSTEEESEIDISDWETYRNIKYGYEIKYPKEWIVKDFSHFYKERNDEEHLSDIRFHSQDESNRMIAVHVYNNSRGLSLNQWLDFYTTDYSGCIVDDRESILIAGIEGIKGNHTCGDVVREGIFLSKENKIYNIDLLKFVTEFPVEDYEKIYSQILSTFKFIEPKFVEPINTSSWKTFTNPEAKFTLKYPSNIVLGDNLSITSTKIDQLEDELPLQYGKQIALIDRQALNQGKYGENIDFALEQSKKVIKIDNKYAKSFMVLARYEVCDVVFERKLIFYNNNYQVIISLVGDRGKIISSMPEYFTIDKVNCGEMKIWDFDNQAIDNFYQALIEHKGSEIVQNWYDTFDDIVKTIEIK